MIAHAEADFRIGDRNDTIKIDGVYSEKGARMLQMPDYGRGAGAACPILLENYRFATNNRELVVEGGEIIDCEAAGPLSMIACKMGSNIKGQQLRIRYAPRPQPGAFNFIGNAIGNDGTGRSSPRRNRPCHTRTATSAIAEERGDRSPRGDPTP